LEIEIILRCFLTPFLHYLEEEGEEEEEEERPGKL